jgi:mRNA interferase HigB
MRVIAKPALEEFWEKHPEAEDPLMRWYRTMKKAVFTDINHLRDEFPSADYVDGLIVFNIGGNNYRLIASIHFNTGKVFIQEVLTHAEYNRNQWKQRR